MPNWAEVLEMLAKASSKAVPEGLASVERVLSPARLAEIKAGLAKMRLLGRRGENLGAELAKTPIRGTHVAQNKAWPEGILGGGAGVATVAATGEPEEAEAAINPAEALSATRALDRQGMEVEIAKILAKAMGREPLLGDAAMNASRAVTASIHGRPSNAKATWDLMKEYAEKMGVKSYKTTETVAPGENVFSGPKTLGHFNYEKGGATSPLNYQSVTHELSGHGATSDLAQKLNIPGKVLPKEQIADVNKMLAELFPGKNADDLRARIMGNITASKDPMEVAAGFRRTGMDVEGTEFVAHGQSWKKMKGLHGSVEAADAAFDYSPIVQKIEAMAAKDPELLKSWNAYKRIAEFRQGRKANAAVLRQGAKATIPALGAGAAMAAGPQEFDLQPVTPVSAPPTEEFDLQPVKQEFDLQPVKKDEEFDLQPVSGEMTAQVPEVPDEETMQRLGENVDIPIPTPKESGWEEYKRFAVDKGWGGIKKAFLQTASTKGAVGGKARLDAAIEALKTVFGPGENLAVQLVGRARGKPIDLDETLRMENRPTTGSPTQDTIIHLAAGLTPLGGMAMGIKGARTSARLLKLAEEAATAREAATAASHVAEIPAKLATELPEATGAVVKAQHEIGPANVTIPNRIFDPTRPEVIAGRQLGAQSRLIPSSLWKKIEPFEHNVVTQADRRVREGIDAVVSTTHPEATSVSQRLIRGAGKGTIAKDYLTSGETVLRAQGQPGAELADALLQSRTRAGNISGEAIAAFKRNTGHLSEQQFSNMVECLRGKAAPMDDTVRTAVRNERFNLDQLFQKAEEVGLKQTVTLPGGKRVQIAIRKRSNYFPVKYDDKVVDFTSLTEKMVESGSAANIPEAEEILKMYIAKRTEKIAGHLQRRRVEHLESFARADRSVLAEYYWEAGKKLAEAEVLGLVPKGSVHPKRVSDLLGAMEAAGGDVETSSKIVDAAMGFNPVSITRMEMWDRVAGLQAATKLSRAVINNATQPVLISLITGQRKLAKATLKVLLNPAEARDFATRAGSVGEQLIKEFKASAGLTEETRLGRLGTMVMKKTGFTGVENWNRVLASTSGKLFAQDAAAALVKNPGNVRLRRQLAKWTGLDADKLIAKGGKLSEGDELFAAKWFSDKTQFRSTSLELPLEWQSSTTGRILSLYKQFAFNQSKMFKEAVLKEIAHGNMRPLIPLFTGIPATGMLALAAKNTVMGKPVIDENSPVWGTLLDAYAQVGGVGIMADVIESALLGRLGSSIMGPVVSDVSDLASAGMQAAQGNLEPLVKGTVKRIPVVGAGLARGMFPPKK